MCSDPIVVVSAARTPIGAFQGILKEKSATDLGAVVIRAVLDRVSLPSQDVSEVLMGCVLPAGLGQAPSRQASLKAGVPDTIPCSTLNKVCGSGMKAIMLAADMIKADSAKIIVAGGMESMTNAPYLLEKARAGQRLGHGKLTDHMFLDGLEDSYDKGRLMGSFAEDTATHYQFTRDAQDRYALTSLERAKSAQSRNAFKNEVTDVACNGSTITLDEGPSKVSPGRIAKLAPAFRTDGTVTAANSSSISDGAAAVILMRRSDSEARGLKPIATIKGHASHASTPALFTTSPIGAIEKLLASVGWAKADVDLYEINEAFAVVVMAAMRDLDLSHDKVNVNGGACALGHPIGASGTRIIVTLIEALKERGLKRGVASLCIGGGEATALAIEVS